MDVFKTRPYTSEYLMISEKNFMHATGGMSPWREDTGQGRVSYYAVCPKCDNPIMLVGLFKQQEESRLKHPYGRHLRRDVPGLCVYRESNYLHCPFADPNHEPVRGVRPPDDPAGLSVWRTMRDEFDHVAYAWETYSGIHLGEGLAERMLRVWKANAAWRYYDADYYNLPQMLFYGAGGRNLVKTFVRRGSPLHERLSKIPEVVLSSVRSPSYSRVDPAGRGFLKMDFLLYDRDSHRDGESQVETFALRVLLDEREAFPDLILKTDPQWLDHARRDMGGRRDRRMLDLARNVLDG
ncbi:hypothetical protein ESN35_05910 [Bifidobacterium pullorum subsp. gallinarum]|uniref:Uncharacterized protein n=1 Tax=Bifidobacterium pullorum subsp. gallinarum TaxID=78344 RepID=A0A4P6DUY8_9BIFI|nr:hypothetical protein [Bifidobacterium pullorum]QAY32987.1 hypothetical protein ESN35_05910 [Bifidobacterium pullorum subsp. gallinarum]